MSISTNRNASFGHQSLVKHIQPQQFHPKRCISQARRYRYAREKVSSLVNDKRFLRSQQQQQPQAIVNIHQMQKIAQQSSGRPQVCSSQNDMYLSKIKNARKIIVNEGISTFSPQKNQRIKVEIRGLNQFTNIVLKRLQKKSNKVSFSQFLQIKKEKDFQSKFKFIFPKKTAYPPKFKDEVAKNIGSFCLGNKPEDDVRKLSKSLVLKQNKRALARSRFREPSKTNQRYPSGLSETFGMKGSLEISRMQLNQ